MDIYIDIKPFWGVKPARFVCKPACSHGEPFARIFLTRGECGHCKTDVVNEDDYLYLLEHEMVEIVSCLTLHEDGIKFSPDGFNKIFGKSTHCKTKFHFCHANNLNSVMVRFG